MKVIRPRKVLLHGDPMPPLVIASDGRQDEASPPSIAALLFDPSNSQKIAIAAVIPLELMKAWGNSEHCIALVEQAALILGIRFRTSSEGDPSCGSRKIQPCCQDFSQGLQLTLVLDAGAATIHLLLAALGARAWFEYVQSDSNWSDGASRLLTEDQWAKANGFTIKKGGVPTWPWLAQGSHRVRYVEPALAVS